MFAFPVGFNKNSSSGPPMTNLMHWAKADTGVTKDGSNIVSVWADQSGHGNNWVANAGSITWVANQINGLPALQAPATGGTRLSMPAFISGTSDGEVFVVIKSLQASTNGGWSQFGSEPTLLNHYPFDSNTLYEHFGLTTRQGPFTVSATGNETRTWGIYNVSASNGTITLRLNGISLGSATGTRGWNTPNFYLFNIANSGAAVFNGQIAEILVYNVSFNSSPTIRTAAYSYLSSKYALP